MNETKSVLITGGAGFIGHHCVERWLKLGWHVQVLDSFKHKGTFTRLNMIPDVRWYLMDGSLEVHYHDLNAPLDFALIEKIKLSSGKNGLDYIVNMASNSAVERSNQDPTECWTNNCNIILHMLEAARALKPRLFFQISTDEVYGDCYEEEPHKEWSTLRPSNVYSASKAAQEQLCFAYYKSFKVPVVITNTMNNYGERQDPEKFIPKLIGMIHRGETVPIYTSKDGVVGDRYYVHCKDHAQAIEFLGNLYAQQYEFYDEPDKPLKVNIAGCTKVSNMTMARTVAKLMNSIINVELVHPESTRPSYDLSYGLDSSLLDTLGWSETTTLEDGLRDVVKFTLEHSEWMG